MKAAWFQAVFRSTASCCCVVAVAVIGVSVSRASEPIAPSRGWDFDLRTSGKYSLQIEHDLAGIDAGSIKATYTITVGGETQSRQHELIVNRPFVPLTMDITSPRHMHVVISGISSAALQHTSVQLLGEPSASGRADTRESPVCPPPCKEHAAAPPGLIPADIQQQLSLPESEIDIGIAALTFAKEIYPDIDIQAYSQKIDVLADKVRWLAQGTRDPERRIRALNTVLFRNEGFHYDRDPFSRSVQRYYFLNGILDTKQGICYTMPLLYIAVAQRLDYPIYPVAVPDHLFVRYSDPSFKEQNIETTSGGKYFPDEAYIEHFSVSSQGLESGSYMRTMTYRELLGHLLAANALVFAREGRGDRALSYDEKATEFNPKFADHYDAVRIGYVAMSGAAKGQSAKKARQQAQHYALKAQQLGFVDPANIRIAREDVRGTP